MSDLHSLDSLVGHLKSSLTNLNTHPVHSIVIGYSGGLDSTLLLQAAVKAFSVENILAVHCDHGISENSAVWAAHCESEAQKLGVKLIIRELRLGNNTSEEAAREARYRCFSDCMNQFEKPVLLLGHHADDQVETLLFRLFRGSGLKGLSAMSESRNMQIDTKKSQVLRPFLGFNKPDLLKIARQEGLIWVEDESNSTDSFDRNFIRNKVLPLIHERWPKANGQFLRLINIFSESDLLLNEYADQLISSIEQRSEVFGFSFSIALLLELTEPQFRLVVRRLVFTMTGAQPGDSEISEIYTQFFQSRDDSSPQFSFLNLQLRRYKERLYFLKELPELVDPSIVIGWQGNKPLSIEGLGTLSLLEGGDFEGKTDQFEIRFRLGSERARPVDRNHSQSLKKLMQESDIEPWLRSRIPLVFLDNELVSVGDILPCSEHRFRWQWQN